VNLVIVRHGKNLSKVLARYPNDQIVLIVIMLRVGLQTMEVNFGLGALAFEIFSAH
jgi:hypothetical protein